MNMTRAFAAIALFTFLSMSAHAANLTPGRWEITVQTVAPVETPATTTEICISKGDAERLSPPKGKPTDDCQSVGALHGNSLKYKTTCGKRKRSSDVELTYGGDHYEGVVVVKTEDETVRQIITAKRIGDCDVDPPPVTVPDPTKQ